jgi:hypothetical protein
MIMFKSTHRVEVRRLEEKLTLMELTAQMFKEIAEERFKQYENQIGDLRTLIFVPKQEPVREVYEADAVISGSEKPLEQSEAERNAYLAGERELDLVLSGNYTEDLLN